MKKFAEVIECNHEEYVGLVAELKKTEGFDALPPGMISQVIYHQDLPGSRPVGLFEKVNDNHHLIVYSTEKLGIETNPLAKFMEWYMSVGKDQKK